MPIARSDTRTVGLQDRGPVAEILRYWREGLRLPVSQLRNAETILRVYRDNGLPFSLALAAVANAKAESNLQNDAARWAPPREWSVGLFQLNSGSAGGAGVVLNPPGPLFDATGRAYPNPRDPRLDPVVNTQTLIDEELTPGKPWAAPVLGAARGTVRGTPTVLDLAELFGRRIERHVWTPEVRRYRERKYREILGPFVNVAPGDLVGWGASSGGATGEVARTTEGLASNRFQVGLTVLLIVGLLVVSGFAARRVWAPR